MKQDETHSPIIPPEAAGHSPAPEKPKAKTFPTFTERTKNHISKFKKPEHVTDEQFAPLELLAIELYERDQLGRYFSDYHWRHERPQKSVVVGGKEVLIADLLKQVVGSGARCDLGWFRITAKKVFRRRADSPLEFAFHLHEKRWKTILAFEDTKLPKRRAQYIPDFSKTEYEAHQRLVQEAAPQKAYLTPPHRDLPDELVNLLIECGLQVKARDLHGALTYEDLHALIETKEFRHEGKKPTYEAFVALLGRLPKRRMCSIGPFLLDLSVKYRQTAEGRKIDGGSIGFSDNIDMKKPSTPQ